jgi:S-adenosylmethionine uptake transporter
MGDRLRGLSPAALLVLAVLAGSAMDATIKRLVATNHVLLVVLARYLVGAMFSAALWLRAGAPAISAEMWRFHSLRGLLISISGAGFFWSFTVLPLAEAITYSFLGVLVIPFAAALMLGERLRLASLAAAGLGFLGVLVAAQGAPSALQSPDHLLGVASVVGAAALFAVAMVLMRARAQNDGPVIVSLLASLSPAFFMATPALALAPPPVWSEWPLFLLMGLFAACFMYLLAQAYARAQAQFLAPIHYTELLWASLFGFVFFTETPHPQIYAGAAIIVAAGLLAAYCERRSAALAE